MVIENWREKMSSSIVRVASDHQDVQRRCDENGRIDSILAADRKASQLLPDDQMFLAAALSLKNQVPSFFIEAANRVLKQKLGPSSNLNSVLEL